MCFEFEALYWAKLAEEEEKKKLEEQRRQAAASQPQDGLQEEPVPA